MVNEVNAVAVIEELDVNIEIIFDEQLSYDASLAACCCSSSSAS